MKLDVNHRSAAIVIILALDLLFFLVWLLVMLLSIHNAPLQDVATKVFGVFEGANNALFLILNTEARKESPTPPAEPAQEQK